MADQDSPKPSPDRSRRAVILATVGIMVIMGLALFIGLWVVPVWQTTNILREVKTLSERSCRNAVSQLGEPETAVRRLTFYVRLPKWVTSERATATFLLGYCGKPATPVLMELMTDSSREVRRFAASALGNIGTDAKAAVPVLVAALESDSFWWVRWNAATALGQVCTDSKKAMPALKRALGDKKAVVRTAAAEAIFRIDDSARGIAFSALKKLLESEDGFARGCAAEVLGGFGPPARECIPALESALSDENAWVRTRAAAALKKIRGEE